MRYFILIVIVAAVAWIIFIQEESTSPDRVSRSLTDSEVVPLDERIEKDEDVSEPVQTESDEDVKAEDSEPFDLEEVAEDEMPVDEVPEEESIEAEQEEAAPEDIVPIGNQEFVSYTNKSIGYTVSRPDKWYWQHFHKSEIGSENPVDDYLVVDRAPLPGLGSEYLGRIVVEVSSRPMSDFKDGVSGFQNTSDTVAGNSAMRHEGERFGSTVIEYHFVSGGKTFRIIYTNANSTAEEISIFEAFVDSFTFTS